MRSEAEMGWDVAAIYEGEAFRYVDVRNDPHAREAFHSASERAIAQGGTDGLLEQGTLDVSSCVKQLAQATGETNRWAVWSPEMVREKLAIARWPDLKEMHPDDRLYVISAKVFLETCAEYGYGIQFDP